MSSSLFAGDFVTLLFEYGWDTFFTDEVAGTDGYETDTVAFEEILNLSGEVLVALDHEGLEEVGVLVAKFGVVEFVECIDVAGGPGGKHLLELIDGSIVIVELGDEEVELLFVGHVGEIVHLLLGGFEPLDGFVGFDEFRLQFKFDAAVGIVAGLHQRRETEQEGCEPGLHGFEDGLTAGDTGAGGVLCKLGELIWSEFGRERLCRIHAELHDERLHGGGVVDVGDFEPQGLALLDCGIDLG